MFFEGGAQLLSELLQARELDYLFIYHAPVLFADDKGKSILRGLRTETLAKAVRLERVRHEIHGGRLADARLREVSGEDVGGRDGSSRGSCMAVESGRRPPGHPSGLGQRAQGAGIPAPGRRIAACLCGSCRRPGCRRWRRTRARSPATRARRRWR